MISSSGLTTKKIFYCIHCILIIWLWAQASTGTGVTVDAIQALDFRKYFLYPWCIYLSDSMAATKHRELKESWGGKGFFWVTVPWLLFISTESHSSNSSSWILKAGTDDKGTECRSLWVSFLDLLSLFLFMEPRTIHLRITLSAKGRAPSMDQ